MEKVINISGRNVPFKSTGAFLYRYKAQFQRDAIADLMKMEKAIKAIKGKTLKLEDMDAIDLTILFNLVWVLAKTADPKIPPPMEWLDTFESFPLEEVLPEVSDMIAATMRSSLKK